MAAVKHGWSAGLEFFMQWTYGRAVYVLRCAGWYNAAEGQYLCRILPVIPLIHPSDNRTLGCGGRAQG